MAPPIELPACTVRPTTVLPSRSIFVSPPSRPNTYAIPRVLGVDDCCVGEIAETSHAAEARVAGRFDHLHAAGSALHHYAEVVFRRRRRSEASARGGPHEQRGRDPDPSAHRANPFAVDRRSMPPRRRTGSFATEAWPSRTAMQDGRCERIRRPGLHRFWGKRRPKPALHRHAVAGAAVLPYQVQDFRAALGVRRRDTVLSAVRCRERRHQRKQQAGGQSTRKRKQIGSHRRPSSRRPWVLTLMQLKTSR